MPTRKTATPKTAPKTAKPAGEASARERLLAAAGELFYRDGIRSVGIDEVIAAADVAKMSLYRSFASKDELIAAYLRERDVKYWEWWDGVVARHPNAPCEQLLALFRYLAKLPSREGWRGCPFTNAATEFPEPDHPARLVAEDNKRKLRSRLKDLAREAGARDADSLADQLVLLFEGVYASAQTFGGAHPATRVVVAAEALLAAQLD
ncbi:MAG TPA: TetR/AcrR family transcriptional regulator [Stellaceae bacterium]|jgi:AcrR family transcriptional regulator|nr:TetR/AcrR family transcriptional regulator [Stellaceae bacterium]